LEYTAKSARVANQAAKEKIKDLVQTGRLVCKYIGPYTLIPNGAVALTYFSQENAPIFIAIHYLGICSAILVVIFFGLLPLVGFLISDLNGQLIKMRAESAASSATENEKNKQLQAKMETMYNKVVWFKGECLRQAVSNSVTSLLFGLWPFLTHKAGYQLALAWSGAAVLLHLMMGIFPVKYNEQAKRRHSVTSTKRRAPVAPSN
jgi:hypothetical protein